MKTMKTSMLLLLGLCTSLTIVNAQTVSGNGNPDNLTKWICPPGFTCVGTTAVANSLLRDNGTTISLGNYTPTPPSAYMMHLYENSASGSHTIGLDIELFNKATASGGQAKAFVTNVQGNNQNYGIDAYTAGGANSVAGNFVAVNSTANNTGVYGKGEGGNNSIGGDYEGRNGTQNYGVRAMAYPQTNTTLSYGTFASSDALSQNNANLRNFGVFASARAMGNVTENTGLRAEAQGGPALSTSTTAYGLYAKLTGGTSAAGPSGSYAGYFWADVSLGASNAAFFNGMTTSSGFSTIISDQQFKENRTNIENALSKVMQLSPASYTYKDKSKYPTFSFPSGKQFGFIAQEVEKVMPEIISEGINPAQYDKDGKKIAEAVSFKGVKYTELIPVLTAAIQEQQEMIATRDKQISSLEERIKRLEALSNNTGLNTGNNNNIEDLLYQNTPNPFNGITEIRYRIPQSYTDANIMIFDMNGKKIKSIAVQGAEGSVSVSASEMAAGLYLYSLIIDGREIATKRMVVNK